MEVDMAEPALSANKYKILIVDDELSVREFLTMALSRQGYLCHAEPNAKAALEETQRNNYDLVISDLRLPGHDGIWLLKQLKSNSIHISVIMLTAVSDIQTAIECLNSGADSYLVKPIHLNELLRTVQRALDKHRLVLQNHEYRKELERRVADKAQELSSALKELNRSYQATLVALVAALDARERETCNHSQRVAEYTVTLARKLGIPEEALSDIGQGALLHDIGKIGITDAILLKPSGLTPDEREVMQQHPQIGAGILQKVGFSEIATEIVLCHQERYDGSGYPRGLKGDEIPIGARIFAVVDAFDCITSNRPYRKAQSYEFARQEIINHKGTQFDPRVVDAFLSIPEEEWMAIRKRTMQAATAKSSSHQAA
jgi:putative nucleotidyltransferase with HDIG domain